MRNLVRTRQGPPCATRCGDGNLGRAKRRKSARFELGFNRRSNAGDGAAACATAPIWGENDAVPLSARRCCGRCTHRDSGRHLGLVVVTGGIRAKPGTGQTQSPNPARLRPPPDHPRSAGRARANRARRDARAAGRRIRRGHDADRKADRLRQRQRHLGQGLRHHHDVAEEDQNLSRQGRHQVRRPADDDLHGDRR